VEVVVGLLAFVGGALGSGLGYAATRGATKVEREARMREEWGRRFTRALEGLMASDPVHRATGRALLVELMRSELASEQDRREASAALRAVARAPIDSLEIAELVDDNGVDDAEGEGA
jgi:hypothetical protein